MRLWRREKRAATGYSDAVVEALLARADGTAAIAEAGATGALEAAAASYSRAFASAAVTPESAATGALTPACLSLIARELIIGGDVLLAIEVDRGGMRLVPAATWDVQGAGTDPDSWTYSVDLPSPNGQRTRKLPAMSVVHLRYACERSAPWRGLGPLQWARATGRLHAEVEQALGDEASGPRGAIMPVPGVAAATDGKEDAHSKVRSQIRGLAGRLAMPETMRSAMGAGREQAPAGDWKPERLGAQPPEALVSLRDRSAVSVMAACGVPPLLATDSGDGTAQRESWRRFLHGSVQPLARLVLTELRRKLDVPALELSFDNLFASDLSGRARAYASLVKAGMKGRRARELAGL